MENLALIKNINQQTLNHLQLKIEIYDKYFSFDDFNPEDKELIKSSEEKLLELRNKGINRLKELQENFKFDQKNFERKIQELKKRKEERQKESEESCKKMNEAFARIKETSTKIFQIEEEIENKITTFYNSFDKYNPNFNVSYHCVQKLCDKLEQYGEPEYFDYLYEFIDGWLTEKIPEYHEFIELKRDDSKIIKEKAIALLRKMDYPSLRRFVTICVSDGMSEEVVNFND